MPFTVSLTFKKNKELAAQFYFDEKVFDTLATPPKNEIEKLALLEKWSVIFFTKNDSMKETITPYIFRVRVEETGHFILLYTDGNKIDHFDIGELVAEVCLPKDREIIIIATAEKIDQLPYHLRNHLKRIDEAKNILQPSLHRFTEAAINSVKKKDKITAPLPIKPAMLTAKPSVEKLDKTIYEDACVLLGLPDEAKIEQLRKVIKTQTDRGKHEIKEALKKCNQDFRNATHEKIKQITERAIEINIFREALTEIKRAKKCFKEPLKEVVRRKMSLEKELEQLPMQQLDAYCTSIQSFAKQYQEAERKEIIRLRYIKQSLAWMFYASACKLFESIRKNTGGNARLAEQIITLQFNGLIKINPLGHITPDIQDLYSMFEKKSLAELQTLVREFVLNKNEIKRLLAKEKPLKKYAPFEALCKSLKAFDAEFLKLVAHRSAETCFEFGTEKEESGLNAFSWNENYLNAVTAQATQNIIKQKANELYLHTLTLIESTSNKIENNVAAFQETLKKAQADTERQLNTLLLDTLQQCANDIFQQDEVQRRLEFIKQKSDAIQVLNSCELNQSLASINEDIVAIKAKATSIAQQANPYPAYDKALTALRQALDDKDDKIVLHQEEDLLFDTEAKIAHLTLSIQEVEKHKKALINYLAQKEAVLLVYEKAICSLSRIGELPLKLNRIETIEKQIAAVEIGIDPIQLDDKRIENPLEVIKKEKESAANKIAQAFEKQRELVRHCKNSDFVEVTKLIGELNSLQDEIKQNKLIAEKIENKVKIQLQSSKIGLAENSMQLSSSTPSACDKVSAIVDLIKQFSYWNTQLKGGGKTICLAFDGKTKIKVPTGIKAMFETIKHFQGDYEHNENAAQQLLSKLKEEANHAIQRGKGNLKYFFFTVRSEETTSFYQAIAQDTLNSEIWKQKMNLADSRQKIRRFG